ncbi:MAG: Dam family site-specific DNA-(adenine-N6)-methyltransferase [Synergistaceae bacterium]|jgi:DNA adenine methylase|nr:Dam family site-specific DNA-(adenine-N6)-methyltransferase [Synergistaceae bacterium]
MNDTQKVHIPPLKIQGIKSKLVPFIRQNLARENSVTITSTTTWIEPFMGSGVVGLNLAAENAIFADLNPHIVAFYNALKTGDVTAADVALYLREQGALLASHGEEYYYHVREKFNREHSPLDFLVLNRSCFNGMIRFNKNGDFNVPYGHKPERFSKAYVTKVTNQVRHFVDMIKNRNWIFICQSFEDTIKMADERAFIYCDPPYIGRHVDYFDSWNERQERALNQCLVKSRARFMLSTWDHNKYRQNPYIDALWGACEKTTASHFYFVGAKEANRNSVTEALLTNYLAG